MNLEKMDSKYIRKLRKDEYIPYDLLLLADETKEAIDRYIHDSEIFVLEIENKIIATYVLQAMSNETVEIKNIAVKKKYQEKGIGTFLLHDAAVKAKNGGFKTLIIGTANAAIKQLYLYQKEGFEIFDIRKNFFIDNYPELLLKMEYSANI